ncbi:2-oxo-4-hydroxy-4-carboxy-5-ureidoimidazoline decarboxylase, partial [Vreelandella glaciei]|uniref:2-oxo-4-hydroxy-4-carboxy-5-ureidoimidazoline decarboxylase n=1 Tax=Vreelandella glaciei TaxID=186761 RepID=UPI003002A645
RFEYLNTAYKEKFGFPFVIAVKGLDRHDILAAFEERLNNDAATERKTAIEQIIRIARFRLRARAEQ